MLVGGKEQVGWFVSTEARYIVLWEIACDCLFVHVMHVINDHFILSYRDRTQMLTSIRQSQGKLEIVDQLLLPHTTEWIHISTVEEAHDAIKSMKARRNWHAVNALMRSDQFLSEQIRGAPAIASLAALSVAYHISGALQGSPVPSFLSDTAALKTHLNSILAFLTTARPTAVNLSAATRRLARVLDESIASGNDVRRTAELLVAEAHLVADEDVDRNMAMSKHGGNWLLVRAKEKDPTLSHLNVLTVCNTGSLATSVCILVTSMLTGRILHNRDMALRSD
jgi:methylthioribose-1-phosphate isomerase